MNKQILQNILIFLERTPMTGKEAVAWIEAIQAVNEELTKLNEPKVE